MVLPSFLALVFDEEFSISRISAISTSFEDISVKKRKHLFMRITNVFSLFLEGYDNENTLYKFLKNYVYRCFPTQWETIKGTQMQT